MTEKTYNELCDDLRTHFSGMEVVRFKEMIWKLMLASFLQKYGNAQVDLLAKAEETLRLNHAVLEAGGCAASVQDALIEVRSEWHDMLKFIKS